MTILNKQQLRVKFKMLRANEPDKPQQSTLIFERLKKVIEKFRSKNIFTYISMGDEVDTKQIISYYFTKGYNVFVPFIKDMQMSVARLTSIDSLAVDKQGNLLNSDNLCFENIDKPDIAIVPLLCYNKRNYRLGYGKGYYDRFFAGTNMLKVGLAYNCQFEILLPVEEFDVPLEIIVTPTKTKWR